MLKISRLIISVAVLGVLVPSLSGQGKRVELVIRDVSVLNPAGTTWLRHQDIIVSGTAISIIQPTGGALPEAKYSVNGSGKFVIPALFDNRVRIAGVSPQAAGLFIAHGVTSVNDVGSDEARREGWRRDVAFGKMMGPRIFQTTPTGGALPASGTGEGTAAAGESLHDVLETLERNGTRPPEVLRRATIESARAHGRANDLGSIEPGKLADLIVLDSDPLTSIQHTRAIDAVVYRGEVLTRAHLNQLLSQARGDKR